MHNLKATMEGGKKMLDEMFQQKTETKQTSSAPIRFYTLSNQGLKVHSLTEVKNSQGQVSSGLKPKVEQDSQF